MTRPGFLSITVVACLIGFASAAACGCGFDPGLAAATLLLALIAHAGGNVLNDYHDARSGADAANTQGLFPFTGGSRLIQQGVVSEAQTRQLALALLLVLVPGGLWLAVRSGGGLLLIGLVGVGLAWAYSAPPLALMRRGLGEAAVALIWWLVVIGADYVQRGRFFLIPAVVAVSYALLVANILLVNGLPDAASDVRTGKRTLAVRLGPGGTSALYAGLAVAAHLLVSASAWALVSPMPTLAALASAPLSALAAWQIARHARSPERLRPAIVLTILAGLVHGLGLAAGLGWVRLAG